MVFLFFFSSFVYEFPPVVVLGERVGLYLRAPLSSYILTYKDFSSFLLPDDALLLPGVYVKRSKGISDVMPKIYLRGFEAYSIPGPGSKVSILVDGVPLRDWASLPLSGIERIEVVKGPYSALYGGSAMGGVVNFITGKGINRIEMGDDGVINVDIAVQKSFKSFEILSSFSVKETEGYTSSYVVKSAKSTEDTTIPIAEGFKPTTTPEGDSVYIIGDYGRNWSKYESGFIKLVWNIKNIKAGLKAGYSNRRYGYRDGKSYMLVEGKPIESGSVRVCEDKMIVVSPKIFLSSYGGYPVLSQNIWGEWRLGKIRLSLSLSGSSGNYWYVSPYNYKMKASSSSLYGSFIALYQDERFSFLFGLDGKEDDEERCKIEIYDFEDPTSIGRLLYGNKGKIIEGGGFVQVISRPLSFLTLYAGGRYNLYISEGESFYLLSSDSIAHDYEPEKTSSFSPRLGVNISSFYISWGKAFRSPTEYELFHDWPYYGTLYLGNPELKPEISWMGEAGYSGTGFDVSLYYGEIDDMIGMRYLDSAEVAEYNEVNGTSFTRIKKKENIERVKVMGMDFGVRYSYGIFSLSAGGSYTSLKVLENPVDTSSVGKQVPGVPLWTGFAKIGISPSPISFTISLRARSKVYGKPDNSDTLSGVYKSYDPYFLASFYFEYRVKEGVNLRFAVDNVFDAVYYDYYRMPGRRIRGGVSFSL